MKKVIDITKITNIFTGEAVEIINEYPYEQPNDDPNPIITTAKNYGIPTTENPKIAKITINNERGVDINE